MATKSTIKVTFRDIAKMLCRAYPIDGQEFRDKVEETIGTIQKLPTESKNALRCAYIFSRKVPRDEREDMFQELALQLLKVESKDEKLCYSVARCDWLDWWRKYKRHSQFYAGTLDIETVGQFEDGDRNSQGLNAEDGRRLRELLVGEVEYQRLDGNIDGKALWHRIPDKIKPIIEHRLLGQRLTNSERFNLHYWLKTKGYQLLLS